MKKKAGMKLKSTKQQKRIIKIDNRKVLKINKLHIVFILLLAFASCAISSCYRHNEDFNTNESSLNNKSEAYFKLVNKDLADLNVLNKTIERFESLKITQPSINIITDTATYKHKKCP